MSDIFDAIKAGDLEAARALVAGSPETGARKSDDGVSAVVFACYAHQFEIARVLAAPLTLSLHEAAALGSLEPIRAHLADDDTDVEAASADGFRALHYACYFRQPAAARALIEAGADVNAVVANPSQLRPLHSAVASRNLETVELLLAAGADVNAVQAAGYTALHAAAKHGDDAIARALIAAGADRAIKTDAGETDAGGTDTGETDRGGEATT